VSATAPARTRGLGGAAAIVCVALGVAAVIGRAKVVAVAPGTAGLYAAIGLPAALPALDFRGVAAEMVGTGSEAALVVERASRPRRRRERRCSFASLRRATVSRPAARRSS
jgi:hypothetical protein